MDGKRIEVFISASNLVYNPAACDRRVELERIVKEYLLGRAPTLRSIRLEWLGINRIKIVLDNSCSVEARVYRSSRERATLDFLARSGSGNIHEIEDLKDYEE